MQTFSAGGMRVAPALVLDAMRVLREEVVDRRSTSRHTRCMRRAVFPGKPGLAKSHRPDDLPRLLQGLRHSGREEHEKERFFDLAAQLTRAKSPAEQAKLKEELARLTFGD